MYGSNKEKKLSSNVQNRYKKNGKDFKSTTFAIAKLEKR